MASRIMHYCISSKIIESISIENPLEFHFGNLAPDLSRFGNGDYEKSHFGYTGEQVKGINYHWYLSKYLSNDDFSDYKLGYFVHLLSDAIWLKNIQDKYIRCNENKESLYQLGYKDMYILNPILINYYSLEKIDFRECKNDIEEIDIFWLNEHVENLNDDFEIQSSGSETKVYPVESVISFIEEAVTKSIEEIYKLRCRKRTINPDNFYVRKEREKI